MQPMGSDTCGTREGSEEKKRRGELQYDQREKDDKEDYLCNVPICQVRCISPLYFVLDGTLHMDRI